MVDRMIRDVTLLYIWGGGYQRVALRKFSLTYIFVTVVDQMILDPVSCPAKIHCTVVFTLRNRNFFTVGGLNHPLLTPFSFVPENDDICLG